MDKKLADYARAYHAGEKPGKINQTNQTSLHSARSYSGLQPRRMSRAWISRKRDLRPMTIQRRGATWLL